MPENPAEPKTRFSILRRSPEVSRTAATTDLHSTVKEEAAWPGLDEESAADLPAAPGRMLQGFHEPGRTRVTNLNLFRAVYEQAAVEASQLRDEARQWRERAEENEQRAQALEQLRQIAAPFAESGHPHEGSAERSVALRRDPGQPRGFAQ